MSEKFDSKALEKLKESIAIKLKEASVNGIASGFRACLEMIRNEAHKHNSLESLVRFIDEQYELNQKYKQAQNKSETADKSV